MTTTITRLSSLAVIAALFAFAAFSCSSAMAAIPKTLKAPSHNSAVTKFTLGVTDRKGNVHSLTLGDRSGRAQTLRKNGLMDCVYLPAATVAFFRSGSPYYGLRAGLAARGCGLWLADSICWTSRQWWGGAARWVVYQVTAGRYDRC